MPSADRFKGVLGMKLSHTLALGVLVGVAIGAAATGFVLSTRDGAPQNAAAANGGGRGGPGGGAGGRGGFAPAVSLAVAQAASVGKTLDVIGEGRALKSVTLTSEATGLVVEVAIAPGKNVKQGDVLLRLDDEQQRIALDRAKAQYPIARDNAERYASLKETEAASALESEAAFNNFKTVEADLRAAQFAVQQRTIVAPFDGVIGLTEIERGDYLRAGDLVATLDDTSSIVVEFAIPQEAASSVVLGQKVRALLASGSMIVALHCVFATAIGKLGGVSCALSNLLHCCTHLVNGCGYRNSLFFLAVYSLRISFSLFKHMVRTALYIMAFCSNLANGYFNFTNKLIKTRA